MNVLVAAFAYNERPYIPYMVEFWRKQGCDLLILDNYSNDGTYEWLVENNIMTSRVDTNESFHLSKLQIALMEEIRKINPDWVVYTGVDMFYCFENGIIKEIEKAELRKRNIISVTLLSALNTGEEMSIPLHNNYFYIKKKERYEMIAKYGRGFNISADRILLANPSVYESGGFMINYGMCKPKEEREETYKRRQKAWQNGLSKGYGTHYAKAQDRQWVWDKSELTDIRTTNEWNLLKKNIDFIHN